MIALVNAFRGQGVKVGERFGVIHRFTEPGKVVVRFKEGFESLSLDQLLPVAVIAGIGSRYAEKDLELEIPTPMEQHDGELQPEISDDDGPTNCDNELDEELEMVEE